jgi:hypothetical protein
MPTLEKLSTKKVHKYTAKRQPQTCILICRFLFSKAYSLTPQKVCITIKRKEYASTSATKKQHFNL